MRERGGIKESRRRRRIRKKEGILRGKLKKIESKILKRGRNKERGRL